MPAARFVARISSRLRVSHLRFDRFDIRSRIRPSRPNDQTIARNRDERITIKNQAVEFRHKMYAERGTRRMPRDRASKAGQGIKEAAQNVGRTGTKRRTDGQTDTRQTVSD